MQQLLTRRFSTPGSRPVRLTAVTVAMGVAAVVASCNEVEQPLAAPSSLSLGLPAQTLADGDSIQATATARDDRGASLTSLPGGTAVRWSSSDPGVIEVDARPPMRAMVRARHPGSARITVEWEGLAASAEMEVRPVATGLLGLSGNGQTGAPGTMLPQELRVRLIDRHGDGVRDRQVRFAVVSGGGTVVPSIVATDAAGIAAARWTLGAQGEQRVVVSADGLTASVEFSAQALGARVDVLVAESGSGQAGSVGEPLARPLIVRALASDGSPVSSITVVWSASAGAIMPSSSTTDAAGRATASWVLGTTAGPATAFARIGDLVASFDAAAVAGAAFGVNASPGSVHFDALGLTRALTASFTDRYGNAADPPAVPSWTTLQPAVASVSAAGVVQSEANGATGITVAAGTLSDTVEVSVQQAVGSVELDRQFVALDGAGATDRLTAAVLDPNGRAVAGAALTWSSSDPAVVDVDATGLVRAQVASGSAVVRAESGGKSDSATVAIQATVGSLSLVSGDNQQGTVGEPVAQPLVVRARTQNGTPIAGIAVSWNVTTGGGTTSAPLTVTDVNGDASVAWTLGPAPGSQIVTASVGTDSVRFQAMAQAGAAAAIDIEPDVISFDALDAQQNLAVTAADRFGNPTSSQGVAWSTSDAVVATVDAGVVTSIGNGSARIRAMLGTAIDSAAVAVQQVVRTATVDPASVQLTSQGATAQLLASGFDASGRAVPNAAWTWASSNSAAVSVTSLGGNGAQVEAQAASGAATITASSGTGVATADVTIAVAVDSVDIQQVPVITEGDTVRAQATPLDAAGNPLVNGVVSWATFPGTFAHVDASGLVTGLHPGTDTLIATSDGVSSSVPVTVDSAVITTVSVLLGGSVIPATDVFVYPGPSAIHSIWGLHPDLRAIAFNAAGMPMTERSGTWVTASALSLPVATGEVAIDEGIEPVRRRLRGVAAGQDEVVVEFAQRGGGVVTSDPVHVSIRPPPTVEIAPADSFSIAAGDSVLIQITPRDHLGEVIPAPAAWGFYFTQDEYEEPVSTSPFVSVACASSPCEGAVTLVVKGLESSGGEVLLGVFYGSTSTQIKVGWVRLYVN